MTTSDKIILGSTAVIAVSAITMLAISKKYEVATEEALSELKDIRYSLSKTREDVIIGNRAISEGNQILRQIVKKTAEDIVDFPTNNTKKG